MQCGAVPDNVASNEGTDMKLSVKPIKRMVYRAWLRSRLENYTRSLHAIAAQRENDFHAERILHRAISATRSKLQSM